MNILSWFFKPKKEKNILSSYPDAVLVVSESGELLYANENLLRILKISSDELFSLELLDIFDGGFNLVSNLVNSEDSAVVRSKVNNDTELFLEIRASLYEDNEDKIIISIRDVTNNKKMLNKLIFEHEYITKLNKNRSTFLTKVSNEITSPLHSINGFSEAILEGLGGDINDKQQKYLKIINKNSIQLLELVNGILEYSKLESGIYDYEFKNFDFVTLMTNLFNKYKPLADEKKLILNFNLNSLTKRAIYSDENVLKRIIETLLDNAIERTESGAIQLSVVSPDKEYLEAAGLNVTNSLSAQNYIMIQVADTSQGLSESELKNIFDPYANIDKYIAKKTVSKSLEMGIVYMLVRILKGRIHAESEENKGCIFSFVIPAEKLSL